GGFAVAGSAAWRMVGGTAVDASLLVAAVEVDALLCGVGNVLGRLDHLAIEIEHVEVAVGRVDKFAWPTPDVRRGQELYTGLGGMRLERRALGRQLVMPDQVAGHLACEDVSYV